MKTIKYITTVLIVVCFVTIGKAQFSTFGFSWSIGMPMGNLKQFITQTSYRGASFEYVNVPNDKLGWHVEGGWNSYYEKMPNATYTKETLTITGTQYRYANSVPLLAGVNYFIMPEAKVKPYVALGMGVIYTEAYVSAGVYTLYSDAWQYAIKPEIGAAVELSESTQFKASAKYYTCANTSDLKGTSYIGFNLGFAFNIQ